MLYPDLRIKRPLISKKKEGNMSFQPRSLPGLDSVGGKDDQPGKGVDQNTIADSREDEVVVVDKEGLSVGPKVKTLDGEGTTDGDCAKIYTVSSTEHAAGACFANQAVVPQPAFDGLGDKIHTADLPDKQIEFLAGRDNVEQTCFADESEQHFEQQAFVPSRLDEGLMVANLHQFQRGKICRILMRWLVIYLLVVWWMICRLRAHLWLLIFLILIQSLKKSMISSSMRKVFMWCRMASRKEFELNFHLIVCCDRKLRLPQTLFLLCLND